MDLLKDNRLESTLAQHTQENRAHVVGVLREVMTFDELVFLGFSPDPNRQVVLSRTYNNSAGNTMRYIYLMMSQKDIQRPRYAFFSFLENEVYYRCICAKVVYRHYYRSKAALKKRK